MMEFPIIQSPLISSANQWTGFYTRGTSVMKELIGTDYEYKFE